MNKKAKTTKKVFTDRQMKLFNACEVVEKFARSVGKDCEIIFTVDGVQMAPLSWRGCITSNSLYGAFVESQK